MGALVAGVDGAKNRWIAVFGRAAETISIAMFPSLTDLVAALPDTAVIAIDMPIGLPDTIQGLGRSAEQAVRPLLGKRSPSLFPVPARRAVYAVTPHPVGMSGILDGLRMANAVARETSIPARGMPIQTFGILPKIRELDLLLQQDRDLQGRFFEIHPELLFRHMNGAVPLNTAKKTSEGQAERRALLLAQGIPGTDLHRVPPRGASTDDMLDAMAAYVAARQIEAGRGQPYPEPFERDATGLPIAIWSWR